MKLFEDQRIVMTLDAGGTNFVFSAIQAGREIVSPIAIKANANDLDVCLQSITDGFRRVQSKLGEKPAAISFAFPGPADYKSGIIGDLGNLPCFRGGVALGPMLEDLFKTPVFIGNDGDLFAYGEAAAGLLPEVNTELKKSGIPKQYRNLFGITLGTGFGAGIVVNDTLCEGDNSAGGEIWLMRNFKDPRTNAEEAVSIRAIRRVYEEVSGQPAGELTPKDIYDIAIGEKDGDCAAAVKSFDEMAEAIAESLCNAITLIDGLIVIGGGLAGAYNLMAPRIIAHMNGDIENMKGEKMARLESKVYNLEDQASRESFFNFNKIQVKTPFSGRLVDYVPDKRIALGLSKLGASRAIALGAYAKALERL